METIESADGTLLAVEVRGAGPSLLLLSGGSADHHNWDRVTPLLATNYTTYATIVAIGPLTNVAELERNQPGLLNDGTVVMMGGWLAAAAAGLSQWGPDRDWNVQCDPDAARIVIEAVGDWTIAPTCPHPRRLVASPASSGARGQRTARTACRPSGNCRRRPIRHATPRP